MAKNGQRESVDKLEESGALSKPAAQERREAIDRQELADRSNKEATGR